MTATAAPPSEDRVRAYGQEIFARLDRRAPVVFSPAWLDDRLMEWSMGDPAIKVQLFRFIDALPNLKSPEEISAHLRDYFNEAGDHLPRWLRRGVNLLPKRGVGGRLLAWAADVNAKRMARRIFEEVLSDDEFRDWPDAGIAIQAYLPDAPGDLDRLQKWAENRGTPVGVRLVKGAYWDYETILSRQNGWQPPVWLHKWQT